MKKVGLNMVPVMLKLISKELIFFATNIKNTINLPLIFKIGGKKAYFRSKISTSFFGLLSLGVAQGYNRCELIYDNGLAF